LGDAKKILPLQHGFDEFLGLPYSNDMWPVNYDGNPIKPSDDAWKRKSKKPLLPLIEGNTPIRYIKTLEDQAMLTT
jgi:arylsulfatase